LHGQDESAAHSHQGNHRQRINPDLKHLVDCCTPSMSVPNQGQSRAHPAQGGPQLNVQAPNIVELTESLSAGNFEKIDHQTASCPE
jgi:hypothetical protein